MDDKLTELVDQHEYGSPQLSNFNGFHLRWHLLRYADLWTFCMLVTSDPSLTYAIGKLVGEVTRKQVNLGILKNQVYSNDSFWDTWL